MDEVISITIDVSRMRQPHVATAFGNLARALGGSPDEEQPLSRPRTTTKTKAPKETKTNGSNGSSQAPIMVRDTTLEITPEDAKTLLEKGYEALSQRVPLLHSTENYGAIQARFLDYLQAFEDMDMDTARKVVGFAYRDHGQTKTGPKALGGLMGSLVRWCKKRGVDSPVTRDKDGYHYTNGA